MALVAPEQPDRPEPTLLTGTGRQVFALVGHIGLQGAMLDLAGVWPPVAVSPELAARVAAA